MDNLPILSLTAFAPLIGAILIFALRSVKREQARVIALVTTVVSFLLSLWMLIDFKRNAEFQYTEHVKWLPELGASYSLGIDGIALMLIVLTTFIGVIAVIWSWNTVTYRGREYYIAVLLLQTGMLGVFMALDFHLLHLLGADADPDGIAHRCLGQHEPRLSPPSSSSSTRWSARC